MNKMGEQEINLVYARGDDWSGLYIEGELAMEGHSINLVDVIGALIGKRISSFDVIDVDIEWLDSRGNLPEQLSDVKT